MLGTIHLQIHLHAYLRAYTHAHNFTDTHGSILPTTPETSNTLVKPQ